MPLTMPESYRTYCTDSAVQLAVDHILDPKRGLGLPADIDWKDLPAFHRAVLSAHQVRCEVAVYLIDLWDAVWQTALNTCEYGSDLKPWSVAKSQHWHGQKFDTYTVWNEGWFSRGFDISSTTFLLAPGVLVDSEQVQLSLCLWGSDDTDYTTGRNLGDDWPEQAIQDGFAWTSTELAPLRDDGSFALDHLHRAASDALAAVKSQL